jgi:uncharacterized protein (DUF58 family)
MMLAAINTALRQRYQHWLDIRLPSSRSVTLDQRRIFIFPSRQGLWFLLLLLVMLIAAINYQNNMVFALVFLLLSVFIISILHTYANLSGLTITALHAAPAFAGDSAEFEIAVGRQGKKDYFDIDLYWPQSDRCSVSLTDRCEQRIKLHLPALKRGLLRPARLCVETVYPLGLLKAWTWLALDVEALIYPRPLACERLTAEASDQADGEIVARAGSDDFYEFRDYQLGDPLRHVFWKSYARGQTLQTKHYAAYCEQNQWLDWQQFAGDTETRLAHLCYWILRLEKSNQNYGLRLPAVDIAPSHGEQHRNRLLAALALFDHPASSPERRS